MEVAPCSENFCRACSSKRRTTDSICSKIGYGTHTTINAFMIRGLLYLSVLLNAYVCGE